ncbi:MAG: 5'-nucleotidase, partial [Oscillospiraceae bacterium]
CAQSGCEIGLFLDNGKDGRYNGKGINGKIYQGDLVPEDLTRILPDLRYDETGTLWKITMSGADLEKTLEYSIPIDNNKEGWFYYFSGLKMDYAPAAVPGTRIHKITDDAGHSLDPKRLYSIAVMDNTVPPEYIVTCEKTDLPIRTIFENALKASPTVSPAKDHRFTLCQP